MNIIRFLISFSLTVGMIIALDTKFAQVPPLGRFLDPFNGFWANARNADKIPSKLQIDGLHDEVEVLYDDMLVPHIFAKNEDDLYLATGYVHAFHRLWQMEFQTHAAAGRLSEVAGEITLNMDRRMRRIGMVHGAENFIRNIDSRSKRILEQYASGVNFLIDNLDYSKYPIEYKLLDYAPEEWTILKSGLLYKYMSDMLNSGEKDLENTNFRAMYGKELLDLIYPDVDNFSDPVVERPGEWNFDAVAPSNSASNSITEEIATLIPVSPHHENNGSNNWAVGPEKSATGNPILCNDMHLSLYMPSLWFYNQQSTNGLNVYGHSLPGIPFVITGFTDSIAWGFTNAQRDLVDWYKIEFENESREKYLLDGKYNSVRKKIEEIKIRGGETFYDTVAYTLFGPVTYDKSFGASQEKNGYARRWIDHDPSAGLTMFYKINRAKNYDDYTDALNHFTSPAQNIVFASSSGNIAHRVQGRYPLNKFEEGKFIKDGTRSENNWETFIPNQHNAAWKNPERGFVSSANQHPVDSTYPYYITARSYESYRNRRINDILRNDSSLTIQDMKNLHFDNYSLKASESLPWMIDQLKGLNLNARELEILDLLSNWDYHFNADSKEAVFYDIWFTGLFSNVWDEIGTSRKNGQWLKYPTEYSTINLLKNYPSHDFMDNSNTEGRDQAKDLALLSFRQMIVKVAELENEDSNLNWGDHKSSFIGHQLRIKPLGKHNIQAGGNGGDVVNATGKNHGPSQRIIVELDPNGVKAVGHYPGGQSGNPGSRFYDNMVSAWANGEYYELLMMPQADQQHERIIFTQTLSSAK